MKLLDRITTRIPWRREAATADLKGKPILSPTRPTGYIDRQITPELLVSDRAVAPVLSALISLSRLCFSGFDWKIRGLDEGDDTQKAKIEQVLEEIKRIDARIGRVGKAQRVGTLGMVRGAFLDGCTFRQTVAEFGLINEDRWQNFSEIQLIPAQSFNTKPPEASDTERYYPDAILPGIVYDADQKQTRYWQNRGMGKFQELDPETLIYIEDANIPTDTSLIMAVIPYIEHWKELRRYAMIASKRVAIPNETVSLDAKDIVAMAGINMPTNVSDLIDYGTDLVQAQGYETAKVVMPGMKLSYPNISMPLNPWEVDKALVADIINYFFHKDILDITAQAISTTSAPIKDLLDLHIAAEREVWGRPYEQLWNRWLEWNGFDLELYFDWWSWTAKDKTAEHKRNLETFRSHAMTLNEFRKLEGLPALDEEKGEIAALADEHALLFGKGANVLSPSTSTVE